jgi:glutamyl-tRNA synthetase
MPAPGYAHVPLVLGADGARLAKRHGAVTLADRAAAGQSPQEVRAELAASLGLAAPGEQPSLDELLARFDPDHLPREATVMAA